MKPSAHAVIEILAEIRPGTRAYRAYCAYPAQNLGTLGTIGTGAEAKFYENVDDEVRNWLQRKWREPAIYAAVIYNDCPIREVRDRKKALSIIHILEEHGYLWRVKERVKIGGSYRKEAWQIHGRILT